MEYFPRSLGGSLRALQKRTRVHPGLRQKRDGREKILKNFFRKMLTERRGIVLMGIFPA